jgi:putative hydrolase of the HAD superfamily
LRRANDGRAAHGLAVRPGRHPARRVTRIDDAAAVAGHGRLHPARAAGLDAAESDALRRRYWQRYGATLLGLVRHHGVDAAHFLHDTHRCPGWSSGARPPARRGRAGRAAGAQVHPDQRAAAYALRVLGALGIWPLFDGVFTIEDMAMFGQLRPKPDARMLRRMAARLGVPPARCVLVEDTLVHQKSARRVGMGTVWMQRWLRRAAARSADRAGKQPGYVDRKVRAAARVAGLTPAWQASGHPSVSVYLQPAARGPCARILAPPRPPCCKTPRCAMSDDA